MPERAPQKTKETSQKPIQLSIYSVIQVFQEWIIIYFQALRQVNRQCANWLCVWDSYVSKIQLFPKWGGALLVRSNFLLSIIYSIMTNIKLALCLLGLLALTCFAQTPQSPRLKPQKKGLTFQATVFPKVENNWVGRFSCNNCNPFEGDQLCSKALPILCINHYKTLSRPLYPIAVEYTPFSVTDGGYYDGWTGGVFAVTVPIRGSQIANYQTGNKLCQGYFGPTSRFATFTDGSYMPYMNQRPAKTYNEWDWGKTKQGGFNFWGYFNHRYRGRAWVWVNNQVNGNCGN